MHQRMAYGPGMGNAASPLTPEQQRELRDAKERASSFFGAARVAAFNGWTVGFCAVVSLLVGILFFSPMGVLVGFGLAVVARNEFAGRRRIRAFDPSGLDLLWRNQLSFMLIICVYCAWSIYSQIAHPDPQVAEMTELLGEGFDDLVQWLTFALYGGMIVGTAICQGLNALYYFVRAKRIREYLRDTPEWVLDVQRSRLD